MKVNVLQVEDAKFHSFMHFWSNWVDIAVYDYASGYLLQMSVSRFNKKKFRSVKLGVHGAKVISIGDLTATTLINQDKV